MNVASKSAVVLSTLTAAWLLARFGSYGLEPLWAVGAAAFVAAFLAGTVTRAWVSRVVLFTIYLSPAAFLVWTGRNHFTFEVVWISALLGLMLSGRDAWCWHVPWPWRWPVILWALIVSASWPIVLAREFDFAPWIAYLPRVSNTSIGISPLDAGTWTLYVVLTHNVGLLWIDWLYRHFATGTLEAFRRQVILPLAAAVVLSCVVGLYQALVDIRFLSGHLWPHMERAAGTLMDANAFGMIAALWGAVLVAVALPPGGTRAAVFGIGALGLSTLGVWASGSRTALLAMTVGLLTVALHGWFAWRASETRGPLLTPRNVALIAFAVAVGVTAVAVTLQTPGITPFERARHLIPGLETTVGHSLWLLWDRMGYGAAAVLMVQEHPWVGVGVGGYHTLVHDFASAAGGYDLPPDNAQNWFRHHLAELGWLGSLPWIAWTLLFLRALFTRSRGSDVPAARLLRGSLLALGLVSLVGMPGQSAAVVITFWTFAFWYLRASAGLSLPPRRWSPRRERAAWAAVLLLVVVHAGGTYAVAVGDLRPAERAVRFGWYYRYGIYDLEQPPDGTPFRWTMRRAAAVIPVEGRVLRFEAWVDHPDADAQPVTVRVWADDRLVATESRRRGERVQADIPAVSGRPRMIIRTEVDRAWRPVEHAGTDPRELGIAIADWNWTR